jgi:hypothetical protein
MTGGPPNRRPLCSRGIVAAATGRRREFDGTTKRQEQCVRSTSLGATLDAILVSAESDDYHFGCHR